MLAKRASDEIDGELLARGYWRMLGHLSEGEINDLTDLVLAKCKWFPTVAECNELMAEQSYANPFYVARTNRLLERNGYIAPKLTGESQKRLSNETDNPA